MHLDPPRRVHRLPRQARAAGGAEAALGLGGGAVEAVGGECGGGFGGQVGGDVRGGQLEELGEERAGGFAALGALACCVLCFVSVWIFCGDEGGVGEAEWSGRNFEGNWGEGWMGGDGLGWVRDGDPGRLRGGSASEDLWGEAMWNRKGSTR